jgi:hypothetical protein
MAIGRARSALARVFFQRCFYLFIVLLVLVTVVPFVEPTSEGRVLIALVNTFVVIAAVAAVGRNVLSFAVALLLAVPTVVFHYLGVTNGDPPALAMSWLFGAALCGATVAYLLIYVFRRDVMTADKLYGAAAAYLLIGVVWAYLYALIAYRYPNAFSGSIEAHGPGAVAHFLYFSFTVLTSTGFGDIVPLNRQARAVVVLEQLVGALFLAILIARLAGVYPPRRQDAE